MLTQLHRTAQTAQQCESSFRAPFVQRSSPSERFICNAQSLPQELVRVEDAGTGGFRAPQLHNPQPGEQHESKQLSATSRAEAVSSGTMAMGIPR